ncbi:hypothetical protein DRN86_02785 [Candidatus Geothermarchaeota archaeon]|nr:MAG: hypothetical protein DRN86_02785 [Candidatus Geothermarchaeota archaeon]
MDIIRVLKKVVEENNLCLNCLGRLFAGLLSGLTNEERGRALVICLSMDLLNKLLNGENDKNMRTLKKLAINYGFEPLIKFLRERGYRIRERKRKCCICGDIFEKLGKITKKALDVLEDYEFDSFIVGVQVPLNVEVRDDAIKSKYHLSFSESIKNELSREIGKNIKMKTGKKFSTRPDLVITINPYTTMVNILSKPVKYEGTIVIMERKTKAFARVCFKCKGKGCKECGFIGKKAGKNVEYILGTALLRETGGKKWRFSIRKLGGGRIRFKIEVEQPKKRKINLEKIKSVGENLFRVESIKPILT